MVTAMITLGIVGGILFIVLFIIIAIISDKNFQKKLEYYRQSYIDTCLYEMNLDHYEFNLSENFSSLIYILNSEIKDNRSHRTIKDTIIMDNQRKRVAIKNIIKKNINAAMILTVNQKSGLLLKSSSYISFERSYKTEESNVLKKTEKKEELKKERWDSW